MNILRSKLIEFSQYYTMNYAQSNKRLKVAPRSTTELRTKPVITYNDSRWPTFTTPVTQFDQFRLFSVNLIGGHPIYYYAYILSSSINFNLKQLCKMFIPFFS